MSVRKQQIWISLAFLAMFAIWSWKARRVFEALLQQPDIDGKRIIVSCGSRYASAALLTAAYEPRVSGRDAA
jgi:hypothetical protein